jgi:hypothetical protein
MWRAAALLEPAPFVGASAGRPLWSAGATIPTPLGPPQPLLDALIAARVVQSWTLCRGAELRPKWTEERRRRALADRFALLEALTLAAERGIIDTSWEPAHRDAPPREERVRHLRAFSQRHRERLTPLLDARIGG